MTDRDALFQQANDLYRQGRYHESEELLNRLLSLGADSAEIFYALGSVALARSDLDRAELMFRRVLDRQPNHTGAHHQLGIIAGRRQTGTAPASTSGSPPPPTRSSEPTPTQRESEPAATGEWEGPPSRSAAATTFVGAILILVLAATFLGGLALLARAAFDLSTADPEQDEILLISGALLLGALIATLWLRRVLVIGAKAITGVISQVQSNAEQVGNLGWARQVWTVVLEANGSAADKRRAVVELRGTRFEGIRPEKGRRAAAYGRPGSRGIIHTNRLVYDDGSMFVGKDLWIRGQALAVVLLVAMIVLLVVGVRALEDRAVAQCRDMGQPASNCELLADWIP